MQKKQRFFKQLLIITGLFACFFTFNAEKIFAQTITDGYTYHGGSGNPADNAKWYHGNGLSSTSNLCFNRISSSGTLNKFNFYVTYSGTPSNELSTIYVLKNNATTTLTTFAFTGGNGSGYSTTTLNMPVTTGDTICLATSHPTWTTNPTAVVFYVNFGIDTEITTSGGTGTTTNIELNTNVLNFTAVFFIWLILFIGTIYLTKTFI